MRLSNCTTLTGTAAGAGVGQDGMYCTVTASTEISG
jgi:hypothetical protein